MPKVYIAAAKRTAIGTFNGALSGVHPASFAADVIANILGETKIPADSINEVLVGNALPAGCGQGVARQASIKAGVPAGVPAYGINMVCGSGMKAIMNAYAAVCAGMGDVFIAGGTENMSMAPYLIPGARQGLRMGSKEILDHMVYDSLTDSFNRYHMGITAENVAEQLGISREEQDAFAAKSQEKALSAIDTGAFKEEIVPITVKTRKAEVVFDTDEHPNRTTNLEKLAGLRAAFKKDGTVTAGNASGINDGAAFVLVLSEKALEQYGLAPMAEVVAVGQGGVDPSVMGLGPVSAIRNALAAAGLKLSDMEIIELNEAFAAQALGVVTQLSEEHGMSRQDITGRANLNGGAIALGHPVGASGARVVVTLLHLLRQRKAGYGLASLCIGGGMGTAVVFRRV